MRAQCQPRAQLADAGRRFVHSADGPRCQVTASEGFGIRLGHAGRSIGGGSGGLSMDWARGEVFGVGATAALAALLIVAQMAGLTRLDIPLLLGTFLTEDPDRARVFGFFLHLGFGQMFALGYALGFAVLG